MPEQSLRSRLARRLGPFLLTFALMMITWVILSGMFDPLHLSMGALSSGLVAMMSSDLLFKRPEDSRITMTWLRFVCYLPWLIKEIFMANLWVLRLCFHPRVKEVIDPKLICFPCRLRKPLAIVTFANSITLTPGTITVDVDVDNWFTVHTIDEKSAAGLPGEMENRIAAVFGEDGPSESTCLDKTRGSRHV